MTHHLPVNRTRIRKWWILKWWILTDLYYEDVLDYEKEVEDVAPVTPPITKSQTTKRQVVSAKAGKPQSVKYKPTTKAIDQERSINTRAFVVHGIPLPETHGRHNTGCEKNRS